MRLRTYAAVVVGVVGLSSCATPESQVISNGSDKEIEAEALRVAKNDIAIGHPRVCYAGTIGVSAVGVPAESYDLVRSLPKIPLPCGCTDPRAIRAVCFARVYNTEVLHYLQEHKK